MVYTYTIPFRDRFIILANLILMITVDVFLWHLSKVLIVAFFPFILFEMMITGILLKWGHTVIMMRFAVLVVTAMFVFFVTILSVVSLCCHASPGLWITILVFYIIIRILYALRLHFLARLCRNDYARKYMMNSNNQQVYSMTSTPMGPVTLPGGTPQRQSEFQNADAIGFANVTRNDPNAPNADSSERNYGWAV